MYSFFNRKYPLSRFLLPIKGVDIDVDIYIDHTGQKQQQQVRELRGKV
jgi:hypothetical protein